MQRFCINKRRGEGMKQKIISLLTAAAMLATGFPVQADTAGLVLAADSVTAECIAGETVLLPIRAEKNAGYAAGTLDITWDSTALILKSVQYDSELAPENSPAPIESDGTYRLAFGSYVAAANFTDTGVFFTLEFEIAGTAEAGSYPVTVTRPDVYDAWVNAVSVSAETGGVTLTDASRISFTAGSAEAVIGLDTEIKIPVTAGFNSGYAAGTLDLLWDPALLTLTAVEYDEALAPANSPAEINDSGRYRLCFGDYLAESDYKGTGVFFTLIFSIAEDAAPGTAEITLADPVVLDHNISRLSAVTANGAVILTQGAVTTTTTTDSETTTTTTETTESPLPADYDFNGDSAVSMADAVLLIRFITEDGSLTAAQTDSILSHAPDLNGDGIADMTDVRLLLVRLAQ